MIRTLVCAAAALLLVPLHATELDRAAQARLGLHLATLQAARAHPQLRATVQVLDPGGLAQQFGRIDSAQAAAQASAAEVDRLRALLRSDGNASRKALESAQARLAGDRATLRDARTTLRMQWGGRIADMPDAARQRWLQRLLDGQSALLLAEPLDPVGAGFAPASGRIRLAGTGPHDASVLERAPRSRSGLAPGWLLEVDERGLAPGMAGLARLVAGETGSRGVLLPGASIVRWNGLDWVYVATGPTRFERRAVGTHTDTDGGWLVGAPFHAGERVVTTGAEALIALDAAPVPGSAAGSGGDDDD